MRIVVKFQHFFGLACGIGLLCAGPAFAQTAALPAVSSPSMNASAPQGVVVSAASAPLEDDPSLDRIGVPPAVKKTIQKFNASQSTKATLEDLNEAREAVAKLDMLIEIEKRLADLSRLKEEREQNNSGGGNGGFSPLPENSLALPAGGGGAHNPIPMNAMGSAMSSASVGVQTVSGEPVVEKVFGVNGKYRALIKIAEIPSTVSAGDKLFTGDVVRSVTSTGIVIVSGGKEKKIDVKNIGIVSGGR